MIVGLSILRCRVPGVTSFTNWGCKYGNTTQHTDSACVSLSCTMSTAYELTLFCRGNIDEIDAKTLLTLVVRFRATSKDAG